jgi:hypothetical protein
MSRFLNNKLTEIENKYLILCSFWCRLHSIQLNFVDCVELKDGSFDNKLTYRADLGYRTIQVKKYEENVLDMVSAIVKFICFDNKIEDVETVESFSKTFAERYLYDLETYEELKDYDEFYLEDMEKSLEFLKWLKEKAEMMPEN